MAYAIDRYNNTLLTTVEDGTVDQTTDLKFIGKNYAGYGEIQNENMLFLLENFSGTVAPPRALTGQLWYDSANAKLNFYDGNQWKASGGASATGTQPTGAASGDFWWDSANNQLSVFNGTSYSLIGPQNAGEGLTQMQSTNLLGTDTNTYNIISSTINDTTVAIFSNSEFTLDSSNAIPGFTTVKKGLTLVNTPTTGVNQGRTTGAHRFYGTATTAESLVTAAGAVISADNVVTSVSGSASEFIEETKFKNNLGIKIGAADQISISFDPVTNSAVIKNSNGASSKILLQATTSLGAVTTVASVNALGLFPGSDVTFNIGSTSLRWNEIHAAKFKGVSDKADQLRYGTDTYAVGSQLLSNSTVAVRTADGNLVANLFQGTATSARYADLAEKYTTAEELPAGTAVAVCTHEDHEVEPAVASNHCIGVVSTDPAYMMNSEADGQYIGLKGRLPVRVKGAVSKGQMVYAWADGVCGTVATTAMVGIALESNSDEGEKLVECVLKV